MKALRNKETKYIFKSPLFNDNTELSEAIQGILPQDSIDKYELVEVLVLEKPDREELIKKAEKRIINDCPSIYSKFNDNKRKEFIRKDAEQIADFVLSILNNK